MDFWKIRQENHVREMQECLKINKTGNELVEYLKTASSTTLSQCGDVWWVPSIESPNALRPFMTQTPEEIHNAGKTTRMDAMFSIVSQVIRASNSKLFCLHQFGCIKANWTCSTFLQDSIQLYPEVLNLTEMWISEQMEPIRRLSLKGFDLATHPKVLK